MSARLALSILKSTRRALASSILNISGVTSHISKCRLFGATTSKFGEHFFFFSVRFFHFYQHHLVLYCTCLSVIFINSRVSPMYSRPIPCLLSSALEKLLDRPIEIYSSDAEYLKHEFIGLKSSASDEYISMGLSSSSFWVLDRRHGIGREYMGETRLLINITQRQVQYSTRWCW